MKKVLMIINPVSGKMKIHSELFDIIEIFCKKGYIVTPQLTQYRGHGAELAESAKANGYDLVVCAGGDGTLNEAISGLLRNPNSNLPLGYIPCGSTNDFADTLSIPDDTIKAAENITNENLVSIDIGRFADQRNFSYIATFGAFSAASYEAPQELKNAIGHLAYLIQGIKELGNIQAHKVKITADGAEYSGSYIYGSVSNTHSVGGIVKLKEDIVDLHDGLFEVILVKKPKTAADVSKILSGAMSSDFSSDMFEFFKAKDITFHMSKSVPWSLDGEKAEGGKIVHIENLNEAVKMYL